jgi:hypothetical protein
VIASEVGPAINRIQPDGEANREHLGQGTYGFQDARGKVILILRR